MTGNRKRGVQGSSMGFARRGAKRCEQGYKRRAFRRPSTRGRRNPAVCNPVCNAERRSRSYHGTGDGKRAQGGLRAVGNRQPSHGPPRTRPMQSRVVEESVEVCVSNRRSGRGLRGGWVVRFFSGLPLALSNDRGLAPAPPRQSAREVPTCPNKAVGAAARRLGRLSRFPTALLSSIRAEGRVREESPPVG